ncbi:replication endonuclease [Aliarcobacter butzleri]|uniref:replication endonuclease n=1 Tax=Aliarcobacter butzleri TaxID=28197 RepID=UPI00263D9253|nr:replication endonuclease [Aliarcobacter butzleri]MDN5096616.1 replication endonuclease [Aliarcobacter butzleri]
MTKPIDVKTKTTFSKKLQETKRYKELSNLKNAYYELSLSKEKKQQQYLLLNGFKNLNTNQFENINYSWEKEYKKYAKIVEQRAYSIEEVVRRENEKLLSLDNYLNEDLFVKVFATLTLPSEYHPFKSIRNKDGRMYVQENPNFEFETIEDAIKLGYKKLNKIFQVFYKRVKNYTKQDLYYIKAVEVHDTLIPHIHFVLFFKQKHYSKIENLFNKVTNFYKINQKEFEPSSMKTNLRSASRYLIKYIIKDLNSSLFIYTTRLLDGLKRKNRIRTFSCSALPLSVGVYKKIYTAIYHFDLKQNSTQTLKEKILQECKAKSIPIFLFIQDNLYLRKTVSKSSGLNVVKSFGKSSAMFKANFVYKIEKKLFKLVDFKIKYKSKLISKKQTYLKYTSGD